ncbi:MAG: nucleotidyltransferase domain-containing protein [Pseudomonadales bacterium]|nr:nucleotidyltransferase domain-containing protein [Pseudomonadales bacterium]
MTFGLDHQTISRIQSVFYRYPEVVQVIIYGSRAKGNFRNGSDIDLTLRGDGLTGQLLSLIRSDLDELNTPYLFDISIQEQLDSADLEEHIKRVGKVFYDRTSPSL